LRIFPEHVISFSAQARWRPQDIIVMGLVMKLSWLVRKIQTGGSLIFFRSGLPQPEIRIGIHLHIETVNQTCIFQGIGVNENTG